MTDQTPIAAALDAALADPQLAQQLDDLLRPAAPRAGKERLALVSFGEFPPDLDPSRYAQPGVRTIFVRTGIVRDDQPEHPLPVPLY